MSLLPIDVLVTICGHIPEVCGKVNKKLFQELCIRSSTIEKFRLVCMYLNSSLHLKIIYCQKPQFHSVMITSLQQQILLRGNPSTFQLLMDYYNWDTSHFVDNISTMIENNNFSLAMHIIKSHDCNNLPFHYFPSDLASYKQFLIQALPVAGKAYLNTLISDHSINILLSHISIVLDVAETLQVNFTRFHSIFECCYYLDNIQCMERFIKLMNKETMIDSELLSTASETRSYFVDWIARTESIDCLEFMRKFIYLDNTWNWVDLLSACVKYDSKQLFSHIWTHHYVNEDDLDNILNIYPYVQNTVILLLLSARYNNLTAAACEAFLPAIKHICETSDNNSPRFKAKLALILAENMHYSNSSVTEYILDRGYQINFEKFLERMLDILVCSHNIIGYVINRLNIPTPMLEAALKVYINKRKVYRINAKLLWDVIISRPDCNIESIPYLSS